MLTVTLPGVELYDDNTSTFTTIKGTTITLEHSLVAISKWESKWKVPFLSKEAKTRAQTLDYIKCMTVTQNVNPLLYLYIPDSIIKQIQDYMDDKMTATWFREEKGPKKTRERVVTSELIYYWMIESNIPMECQKWHLNRLITLIQVVNEERKAADPNNKKRRNPRDIAKSRSELNRQRRELLNSRG